MSVEEFIYVVQVQRRKCVTEAVISLRPCPGIAIASSVLPTAATIVMWLD